jgi:26S proteasome regulatory subunit N11
MDRLNRMLATAGGMGGLNSAAPGSVSYSQLLDGSTHAVACRGLLLTCE